MLCRSVSWFLCTLAAAAVVSGYSLPASNTAPSTVEEVGTSSGADLGHLLDDGDDATVAVVAGDTRLRVHRAVLAARGPAFLGELVGGGATTPTPTLEGAVLRQLVAYLYSLRPPRRPELNPGLLAAADRYRLRSLKADLEQQLIGQLTPEDAVAAFYLATRHSCDSLRKAAVAYIREHFADVFATRGWAEATEDRAEVIAQLIRLLSDLPEERSSAVPAAAAAATTTAASPATEPPGETTTPGTALAGRTITLSAEDYTSLLRRLDPEERTEMLMEAAYDGELVELEALQAAGADVRAVEQTGDRWTALHYAAMRGEWRAVRWLLAAGAAVDAKGHGWARTPLHVAARWGHAGVVRLLLAAGADPSATDLLRRTPLHWAALSCRTEIVAALLHAGADRQARDYEGKTALDHARWSHCEQLVRLLEA